MEVSWSDHASERFLERAHPIGVTIARLEDLIRSPNMKRRTSWILRLPRSVAGSLETDDGLKTFRIVFVVEREMKEGDSGAIHVVSVVDESR